MMLARQETEPMLAEAELGGMVRSDGSLELYGSEAEFVRSLPGWAARQHAGILFEHLRGAEIARYQPGLSPRFVAATFVPEWKTVSDPYELACGLAEHLQRNGAVVQQDEVNGVAPHSGGVLLKLASGSPLRARKAVLAAGAWSRHLAGALGDRVPLETERGYNTTLPATAFDLRRQLIFGGHGFVATPLATGIRIGGAVELGGLHGAPDYRRSEAMLRKAAAFLPGLNTEGGRQWMGFRPSLPDSLPVIGRSRASPDVVYAFGHGHLGLTQAAATGRLVADLVLGRPPAIPVEPFRAGRFH
jgi:D-amino-acid dehydrogenase